MKGTYDLIIMKSVLGGVFRKDEDNIGHMNNLLSKLVVTNLNDDGLLVTLDNGISYFESILAKMGSRSYKWRFFTYGEITKSVEQVGFGVLSAFSFKSRLGKVGAIIEHIIFYLDCFLFYIFKSHPSVICTVLKKKPHSLNSKEFQLSVGGK